MAKAIKSALIAAFVVWVTISTFGTTGALWGGGSFMATWSYAAASALVAGASTLLSSGIGMLMSKGIEVGAQNFGTKATIKGAANPRQLVYGETVVGGTLAFIKTSGTDNNNLHMIVALAGHEINAISEVRLNGEALTSTTSTINGTTVHTATNANFTNTENDNNFGSGRLIRFTKHLGASDQTYDAYAAAQIGTSIWTSDHRLRGVAYIYIQCRFDNEKFGGGIPQITAKVQGKKIYDPRTSTTVFSANPALCLRDYLLDTTNGLGALSTEINDSSSVSGGFVTAANICDQDVDDIGGNPEDRYTMNGFFHTSGDPASAIESMLSSCAGKVSYSNGKFNLFAGAAQTPTLTITDEDILAPIEIMTQPDTANLFNGVKGIYVDKNNKYQAADIPIHLNSTYLGYDTPSGGQTANFEKYMELQFPYTLSESTAQRLARIGLKANRQTTTITVTVNLKYYQLQVGDWVRITNDRMSWTNKYFEVLGLGFEAAGGEDAQFLAVQLILKETEADIFAFDTDNDYVGAVAVGTTQDTTSTPVSPPTNLDTTAQSTQGIIHFIKVTWTPAAAATIQNTEIYYKVLNANDNTQLLAATTNREATVAFIHGVTAGVTYQVRARHKGRFGNYSAYTSWDSVVIGSSGSSIDDEDDILNSEVTVTATTFTTGSGVPNNSTTPDPNPNGSTYLNTATDPDTLYISNGTSWVLQGINSNTVPTFTSSSSAPDNATVPSPNPMGSSWLHTTPDPDVLYIANATDWVAQNINSNTLYTLPTHTSGSGVPNNNTTPSPNPLNSTYLNTATTPDTLYISDGSSWVEYSFSAGDFNITGLAGYSAGAYANSSIVLPTFTTGSGVPSNSTTPSPNPAGSSYLNTATNPDTLYISNGSTWILQSVNSDTQLTIGTGSGEALEGNTSIPVDLTVSGSGTVHANNYTDTQYTIGTLPNSPFDASGNFDTNFTLNSTMTMGTTNAAHKITVGSRLTIDGDNERILITDAT